jgi:hypothetical protein
MIPDYFFYLLMPDKMLRSVTIFKPTNIRYNMLCTIGILGLGYHFGGPGFDSLLAIAQLYLLFLLFYTFKRGSEYVTFNYFQN